MRLAGKIISINSRGGAADLAMNREDDTQVLAAPGKWLSADFRWVVLNLLTS